MGWCVARWGTRGWAIGLVLLAACGPLPTSEPVGQGEPAATTPSSAPATVTLPTLPDDRERFPDMYDERGCIRLGPEPDALVDCGAPPSPGEPQPPEDPDAWKGLMGFIGPYYNLELRAQAVVVLEQSVTTTTQGSWGAWGLVRNETPHPVGKVHVTASLLRADGTLLGEATGQVPVDPLRPGEPGPFSLTSTVAAAEVAGVEWSVGAGTPSSLAPRDLEILLFWDLPYGDRERDPLLDPETPPYPYVQFGRMHNLGTVPLPDPGVVGAWVNGEDRIVMVVSPVVGWQRIDLPGSPIVPVDVLEPGAPVDFYFFVSDPEMGPRLSDPQTDLNLMLWGVGG